MKKESATAVSHPHKPMPKQIKVLEIDGAYTLEEYAQMQQGFVPSTANDKWFIYFSDHWLNFHRSRAGTCIFQLELIAQETHVTAKRVLVNANPQQYRSLSDEYDVQLLSYVIETILLGRFAPFPNPPQFSEKDQKRHKQHVMGQNKQSISLNDLLSGD